MQKLILCEKCKEKFERGGMRADWARPPRHFGEKQTCAECGKKRYCGDCAVGE